VAKNSQVNQYDLVFRRDNGYLLPERQVLKDQLTLRFE